MRAAALGAYYTLPNPEFAELGLAGLLIGKIRVEVIQSHGYFSILTVTKVSNGCAKLRHNMKKCQNY